jgi:hypothetical protein
MIGWKWREERIPDWVGAVEIGLERGFYFFFLLKRVKKELEE